MAPRGRSPIVSPRSESSRHSAKVTSRSPSFERDTSRYNGNRSKSRSRSPSLRALSRSRSRGRSRSWHRSRSFSRTPSSNNTPPRSSKVCTHTHTHSLSHTLSLPFFPLFLLSLVSLLQLTTLALLADTWLQIVIEKLTKNVTAAHLREIFGSFGDIESVDLPMNRACKGFSCIVIICIRY